MMKMKGRAALAAAVLAAILNAGTLQAADEASSLEGDSVSYDMATGEITAEGGITLKSGTTTITGARASYNTKTQQGEITGGVVAVHDAMRLTAQTVTLESAAAIHATGGAEITKDDLRLTAEKLSVFDQDRYVAEGNVRAVKADKTFTGARAEFTQSTNYLLAASGGTVTAADGTFSANRMEGWLAEERYHGEGSVHVVSPPRSFEGGGDTVDYFAKAEDGKGKCVLDGNAWAYQGNNMLKSHHLTVYLANTGTLAVE